MLVILGLLGGGGYYAWKSGVITQAYTWVMEKAQSLNNVTVPKNREAEKSAPLSASLPDEPLLRRTPERDVKSDPEKPSVPQQALPEKQPEPEKPVIMPEKAPADAKQVVIVATEPCWIHSTADGTDTRQFSLRKGDTFALTFKENLEVKLGNAGGVSFRYNGEDLPPVGKPGQVKTIVFPSKDVQ